MSEVIGQFTLDDLILACDFIQRGATPVVGTGYKNTYLFYINIVLTIIEIIKEPVMMLTSYNLFNSGNLLTIIWFTVHFLLAIYGIILELADENI